jgi:hypothetical protein
MRKKSPFNRGKWPLKSHLTNYKLNTLSNAQNTQIYRYIYLHICISSLCKCVIVHEGPSEITGKYRIWIYFAKNNRRRKTETSFDPAVWGIISNKQRSINGLSCKQDKPLVRRIFFYINQSLVEVITKYHAIPSTPTL